MDDRPAHLRKINLAAEWREAAVKNTIWKMTESFNNLNLNMLIFADYAGDTYLRQEDMWTPILRDRSMARIDF